MRATFWLAVAVGFAPAWAAEPKDPKTLDVPAEKTKEANALIAKLDDGDVLVRDRLTEKLKGMGRDALPALLAAIKAKPADRVLDRLLVVLPTARKADLDARAECFLADKDRKYDHTLPGWNELKAAVKDTKESRLLFTDILADEECRDMLILSFDPTEDARKGFENRWKARVREWQAKDSAAILAKKPRRGPCPPADGPIHWMPAALLADLLCERDYHNDYRHHAVLMYLETDEGKLATAGKGRYGEVVRTFATNWVSRQHGRFGMRDAHLIAFYFKLDEGIIRGMLEKQFELSVSSRQPNGSLSQLSNTRDAKYIASFRRLFDATGQFRSLSADVKAPEIEVRDAALSMCIALSGQDPVDFGFTAEIPADAKKDLRYDPYNYFFDGDDKTADEKRKAAFKKWAEWEKANPDKIKAKPPEKKEK